MALSDLDYIRLILSIPHRQILNEELGLGDGYNAKFQTQLAPIIAATQAVRVDKVAKVVTTDYAINELLGLVTFVAAPAEGAAVTADYVWSVFTDVQINGLLAQYNNTVISVLKDLVRALLSNADLFIKYTIGMESVDRATALQALKTLHEDLTSKVSTSATQAVIWTAADAKLYNRDVPWEPFLDSIPED